MKSLIVFFIETCSAMNYNFLIKLHLVQTVSRKWNCRPFENMFSLEYFSKENFISEPYAAYNCFKTGWVFNPDPAWSRIIFFFAVSSGSDQIWNFNPDLVSVPTLVKISRYPDPDTGSKSSFKTLPNTMGDPGALINNPSNSKYSTTNINYFIGPSPEWELFCLFLYCYLKLMKT